MDIKENTFLIRFANTFVTASNTNTNTRHAAGESSQYLLALGSWLLGIVRIGRISYTAANISSSQQQTEMMIGDEESTR
jgi:hypothetical protein